MLWIQHVSFLCINLLFTLHFNIWLFFNHMRTTYLEKLFMHKKGNDKSNQSDKNASLFLLFSFSVTDSMTGKARLPVKSLSSPSTLSTFSSSMLLFCGAYFPPAPSFSIRKWVRYFFFFPLLFSFVSFFSGWEREMCKQARGVMYREQLLVSAESFCFPGFPIHHKSFGGKTHKEARWPRFEPFDPLGATGVRFSATVPSPFCWPQALASEWPEPWALLNGPGRWWENAVIYRRRESISKEATVDQLTGGVRGVVWPLISWLCYCNICVLRDFRDQNFVTSQGARLVAKKGKSTSKGFKLLDIAG